MKNIGVIVVLLYCTIILVRVMTLEKQSRTRLYGIMDMTKNELLLKIIGSVICVALCCLIIKSGETFSISTSMVVVGFVLYGLGMICHIITINTFARTQSNIPVTTGFYRITRNPQLIFTWVCFLGQSLIVNSIDVLFLLGVYVLVANQYIALEEERCHEQYGNHYIGYANTVPRYY